MQYDVLIIGAGAAGLMAAKELAKRGLKVIIVEARDRVGGRIHTINNDAFLQSAEVGAEFIHGKLKMTLRLLKEAGINYQKTSGAFLRKKGDTYLQEEMFTQFDVLQKNLKKVKRDISVAEFLNTYFKENKYKKLKKSVISYVEGYYAAEATRASTLALKEELLSEDEEQYRVEGGYTKLVNYLKEECLKKEVIIKLSTVAKTIEWSKGSVLMHTTDGESITAKKVLITLPLGVLQSKGNEEGTITFAPRLTQKIDAISLLGFGSVIKLLIQFNEPFWQAEKDLRKASFIFSDEEIPTWWTQYPKASGLLVGWCAGPSTKKLQGFSNDELIEKSMHSLAPIFGKTYKELWDKVVHWEIANWANDPFTKGGYTYITTETKKALKVIRKPEKKTIYFAGEGLYDSKDVGTVEAALQSGAAAAKKIVSAT
jgi:monoamine oxidase